MLKQFKSADNSDIKCQDDEGLKAKQSGRILNMK